MEKSFEQLQREEDIRKKVKAMSGFYKHLTAYIGVNVFIWVMHIINMDHNESFFQWNTFSTALFWGVGVFFHWYSVFESTIVMGRSWEERKIKEMLEKEKSKTKNV